MGLADHLIEVNDDASFSPPPGQTKQEQEIASRSNEFEPMPAPPGSGQMPITPVQPAAAPQDDGVKSFIEEWAAQQQAAADAAAGRRAASDAIGKSNFDANREKQLALLGIDRQELDFTKKIGFRDIEQAREKNLKGAISNALRRGIFQSGIHAENVRDVHREQDEAGQDLKQQIQFALDRLDEQEKAVKAQKYQSGGSGAIATNPLGGLTEAQIVAIATQAQEDQTASQTLPAGPSAHLPPPLPVGGGPS